MIQTAAGQIPALPRGVLLVCNKPSSVIHTTQGSLQAIQVSPSSLFPPNNTVVWVVLTVKVLESLPTSVSPPNTKKIIRISNWALILLDRSIRIPLCTQIKPEPHVGSGGSIMTDTNSDDTMSDDEASPKKRRDLLTRRPSYRKILSDLGGAEIGMFLVVRFCVFGFRSDQLPPSPYDSTSFSFKKDSLKSQ